MKKEKKCKHEWRIYLDGEKDGICACDLEEVEDSGLSALYKCKKCEKYWSGSIWETYGSAE